MCSVFWVRHTSSRFKCSNAGTNSTFKDALFSFFCSAKRFNMELRKEEERNTWIKCLLTSIVLLTQNVKKRYGLFILSVNKYFWIKCLEYERDTTPTLKWKQNGIQKILLGFHPSRFLPIPYKTIFIQLARPSIRPQSSPKPQDYPFEAEPCFNEEDDKRGYFGRIWRTQIWQVTASLYPPTHTHLVED